MGNYDLRGAVDASHFDLVKDINWYRRRGGGNLDIGKEILNVWTHMISIATLIWPKIGGRCKAIAI